MNLSLTLDPGNSFSIRMEAVEADSKLLLDWTAGIASRQLEVLAWPAVRTALDINYFAQPVRAWPRPFALLVLRDTVVARKSLHMPTRTNNERFR